MLVAWSAWESEGSLGTRSLKPTESPLFCKFFYPSLTICLCFQQNLRRQLLGIQKREKGWWLRKEGEHQSSVMSLLVGLTRLLSQSENPIALALPLVSSFLISLHSTNTTAFLLKVSLSYGPFQFQYLTGRWRSSREALGLHKSLLSWEIHHHLLCQLISWMIVFLESYLGDRSCS